MKVVFPNTQWHHLLSSAFRKSHTLLLLLPSQISFLQLVKAQSSLRETTQFSSRGKQRKWRERGKVLLRKKFPQNCLPAFLKPHVQTVWHFSVMDLKWPSFPRWQEGNCLPCCIFLLTMGKIISEEFCGSGTRHSSIMTLQIPEVLLRPGRSKTSQMLVWGWSRAFCIQFWKITGFPISGFLQHLLI